MGEFPRPITGMLRGRRLERVTPGGEHARAVIAQAERHVETARILATTDDQAMAFTAAYDAARKALSAVLAARGLRVRPVGGAHYNTGVAAAAFVTDDALADFEWMRQVRNATEYPSEDRPGATESDVAEAIEAAADIVAACRRAVSE
ncbi:MAG: HEPN domain-containing protein [Mobilicoccus sp.]|nr:HEPN domain-containing protein [Mobilicoccus sp.]MDO5629235.1 HEPN domain-containing protein [Mobilicoccus sp.]